MVQATEEMVENGVPEYWNNVNCRMKGLKIEIERTRSKIERSKDMNYAERGACMPKKKKKEIFTSMLRFQTDWDLDMFLSSQVHLFLLLFFIFFFAPKKGCK